jgi:NADPH2:quinone reductase
LDLLAIKPSNLTMPESAARPLRVITAGAGRVDHIAIQIAKAMGAEVVATVSDGKRKIAEQLGATPIDCVMQSVGDCAPRHTAGEGFDIVCDTVGGTVLMVKFSTKPQR